MVRELTCIVCPVGCRISVEIEKGNITNITGNTCPKGAEYTQKECTNPERTVTSTVKSTNGEPISVKTDKTIPKDKMFEGMEMINNTTVELPVSIGDIIIENVFGSNVVATQNKGL